MMNNEQMRLMKSIYEYSFAVDDALLYMDTHPCDQAARECYDTYVSMRNKYVQEYTSRFGPLTKDTIKDSNQWSWGCTPWPWEMEAC